MTTCASLLTSEREIAEADAPAVTPFEEEKEELSELFFDKRSDIYDLN